MATVTKERRTVHYESLQDLLADAEQKAAANATTVGNWSMGQVFDHLARTMECSLDGFQSKLPFYIRWGAKLFKKRILTRPMSPGYKLPKNLAGELDPAETVDTQEGLERMRNAIARLENESQRAPSPAFGVMTVEEWNLLHLRHGELHMSFIVD